MSSKTFFLKDMVIYLLRQREWCWIYILEGRAIYTGIWTKGETHEGVQVGHELLV